MKLSHILLLVVAITSAFAMSAKQAQKTFVGTKTIPGVELDHDSIEWYLLPENEHYFRQLSDYVFEHLDYDMSGEMSINENEIGIAYLCGHAGIAAPSPADILNVFNQVDKNSSQGLDINEFYEEFDMITRYILSVHKQNNWVQTETTISQRLEKTHSFLKNALKRDASGTNSTNSTSTETHHKQHHKKDGEAIHHTFDGEWDFTDAYYSEYSDYSETDGEEEHKITSEELFWLLEPEHKEIVKAISGEMFLALDFNGTGDLQFSEVLVGIGYLSGRLGITPPSVYDVMRVFDEVNLNTDRSLDKKEFTKGFRKFMRFAARELKEIEDASTYYHPESSEYSETI